MPQSSSNTLTDSPAGPSTLCLICLPHAGGGPSAFRAWRGAFGEAVDVVTPCLPGREARLREPAHTAMTPLVRELADSIAPRVDRPWAIFGHSAGALIGFELAHVFAARGNAPGHLFAAGSRAPHAPAASVLHTLSDERLVEAVAAFGGTAPGVLREPELLAMTLPAIRADLTVIETHAAAARPPLDLPITVLGGDADALSPRELGAWAAATTAACDIVTLPGGHFFTSSARDAVLDVVARRLQVRVHAHPPRSRRFSERVSQ